MEKFRVLIYTDTIIYGGHEVTLYQAIIGILESRLFDVTVMVSSRNDRFQQKLSELAGEAVIVKTDFETERGDVFRALFATKKVRLIAAYMNTFDPDVVVVSQGAIGLSACGLKAARLISAKLVSFLPMAHPVAVLRGGNSVGVTIQELLYRRLYAIPDYFFTICKSTADMLSDYYGIHEQRIFVSYYGIDLDEKPKLFSQSNPSSSGQLKKIGLIGRVEFIQKRHDFFLRTVAKTHLMENLEIHIVGDGPDLQECKDLALDLGLGAKVIFHGWMEDVRSFYRELDLVVLPSRFEGLPLVLIESMLYGLPVVASSVDGMKEFLPSQWLFQEDDPKGMLAVLAYVLSNDQSELIKKNQDIALERLQLKAYKESFRNNLLKVCNSSI